MAKGVEDTAFYVYNRLVSLNEVGGEPGRFGAAAGGAPPLQQRPRRRDGPTRCRRSPRTTPSAARTSGPGSTSCPRCPTSGRRPSSAGRQLNARHRIAGRGAGGPGPQRGVPPLPDPPRRLAARSRATTEEYAAFVDRIQAYMVKALHEAKVHTSWINPNADYDEAVDQFVAAHPRPEAGTREFLDDFLAFQRMRQPLRPVQLARADAAQDRRARRARHLPGDGAVGLQPGRSRQPPARRLRAPGFHAGRPGDPVRRPGHEGPSASPAS